MIQARSGFHDGAPLPAHGRVIAASLLLMLALCGCSDSKRAPLPAAPPRDLNVTPVAQFEVELACGPVTLDASASVDPDGSIVLYEWDLENDGVLDTAGAALVRVAIPYATGTHHAKLVVTDDKGAFAVTASSFSVSNPDTFFVSSATGSSGGDGSRASPFSTVSAALSASSAHLCRRVVLVAMGYYPEAPALPSDLILRGGFNPATWQQFPGEKTEIWVGAQPARLPNVHDVEISDIRWVAPDMADLSTNSVAMIVTGSISEVRFDRCAFVAGNAVRGYDGGSAGAAIPGLDGPPGNGRDGGSYPPPTIHSPEYGPPGPSGPAPGASPVTGYAGDAKCRHGGGGGLAGTSRACGNAAAPIGGGAGGEGQNGDHGVNGSATTSSGAFSGSIWVAASGQTGTFGCRGSEGGSGGAGGSSCTFYGGGGGAGATGGFGGSSGLGGRGGGASIAVLLLNSSPVFADCAFVSARGGDGGAGGNGGTGAGGGIGGAGGATEASIGGKGGNGGQGGNGGGGQGGPGGPSWCLVRLGSSSPNLIAPVYTIGSGGIGGVGGRLGGTGPQAASGPNGPAAALGP